MSRHRRAHVYELYKLSAVKKDDKGRISQYWSRGIMFAFELCYQDSVWDKAARSKASGCGSWGAYMIECCRLWPAYDLFVSGEQVDLVVID